MKICPQNPQDMGGSGSEKTGGSSGMGWSSGMSQKPGGSYTQERAGPHTCDPISHAGCPAPALCVPAVAASFNIQNSTTEH